jgi:hypothetical protein
VCSECELQCDAVLFATDFSCLAYFAYLASSRSAFRQVQSLLLCEVLYQVISLLLSYPPTGSSFTSPACAGLLFHGEKGEIREISAFSRRRH